MLPSHLITFEQACSRLGIDESTLDALIEEGTLTTQAWMGDVYLLAAEVAARASRTSLTPAATPRSSPKPRRTADDGRIRRVRSLLDSGVREVRAAEARDLLGIGQTQMCKLAREGRVNYIERNGRRWYLVEDIETYAGLQNVWASKSGGWTPYGKADEASREQDMKLVGSARRRAKPEVPAGEAEDYRLTLEQVLSILNVSYSRLHQMVNAGALTAVRVPRAFGRADSRGRPITRLSPTFSAREVYGFVDARERRQAEAGFTASQWKERMARPFIRTQIAAPQNDLLVTPAEAARMLGISAKGVSNLVCRGRLFGWQTQAGKPGCPLYLSAKQVARYRDDPDRLKRQAAATRYLRPPSKPGEETNGELWLEETGMALSLLYATRTNLERQHGDFLNTGQAARLLGIAPKTLCALRQRGRIAGYQRPRKTQDGRGHKWWFFRREDVDKLLLDGEYVRRRDVARANKLKSMGRQVVERKPEW